MCTGLWTGCSDHARQVSSREVGYDQAAALAKRHGMMYMECSAKTREGIEQTFVELSQKVLETPAAAGMRQGVKVRAAANQEDQGSCAC